MKYQSFPNVVPALAVALSTLCGVSVGTTALHAQEHILGEQILGSPIEGTPILGSPVDSGYIGGDVYSGNSYPTESYPAESYSGDSYPTETVDGGTVYEDGSFVGDMSAGVIGRAYGQPDLFYNYYTQGNASAANAQMYLSPLPVPPNVGHTHFTYQPFYPEEMLYWHKNKFHNYYDNGRGMNRTRATYFSPPVRQTASNIYWNFLRIPR
ncbi:hypothetical protein Poly51_24970 [Rubripirellula tenax]|uniref:Uncharacterized protein n=1 Tax=Rubripirellula tenax TaxID=2528015 RepID=A0A5C6FAK6_9BACT|nr:hypothetical protein [Rubripirellula tenax]TWU56581.1 hypothetical protein Poly51_24970 [Rubripirellula tenax]